MRYNSVADIIGLSSFV